jgi:S1-C subfamily serine protease
MQDITNIVYSSPTNNYTDDTKFSTGTGVFRTTKDGQLWVLTCAHVVHNSKVIDFDEDGVGAIRFNDAFIHKIINVNGDESKEYNFRASVVRYSSHHDGIDFALLRVIGNEFTPQANIVLPRGNHIAQPGTHVIHCGNFTGARGHTSLSVGIVSQLGRIFNDGSVFDQTTASIFPGSSGGAICDASNKEYLGMVVRRHGETLGFYRPIREMREWANAHGVGFILDDSQEIPTAAQLSQYTIED